MSDDEEYEYEYDDDASMQDEFEYSDDGEQQDDKEVELENAYYNAKGMRDESIKEAAEAFEDVINMEWQELSDKYGPYSFKSMKQLVKLQLRAGNYTDTINYYRRLLAIVGEGNISPNAVEKGINGMLERVASLLQGGGGRSPAGANNNISSSGAVPQQMDAQQLALSVYDSTLRLFHPSSGACPNERLWFKTNLKYGQLLYEMNETVKLQQVLKDLQSQQGILAASMGAESSSNSTSSTQLIEIYALQIQLYSRQKDNKKLRETFTKAMSVRGGIPHPRTLAMIQELGGKMHMASKEYEQATQTFFQAFKSYDEAGDMSRLRCLKYLVLASMLHKSAQLINPFDSQEARPYRDDPEIAAMTNLVQAFQNNEIHKFERILQQNRTRIMGDEFIREHIEDLLRTIRTQVLRRVVRPYSRISLAALAKELNAIGIDEVENLLVGLILDGSLEDGKIDQVNGILLKKAEGRIVSGSGGAASSSSTPPTSSLPSDAMELKLLAMSQISAALEDIGSSATNAYMKESGLSSSIMRGMVHLD